MGLVLLNRTGSRTLSWSGYIALKKLRSFTQIGFRSIQPNMDELMLDMVHSIAIVGCSDMLQIFHGFLLLLFFLSSIFHNIIGWSLMSNCCRYCDFGDEILTQSHPSPSSYSFREIDRIASFCYFLPLCVKNRMEGRGRGRGRGEGKKKAFFGG